jgi:hypothetical protein
VWVEREQGVSEDRLELWITVEKFKTGAPDEAGRLLQDWHCTESEQAPEVPPAAGPSRHGMDTVSARLCAHEAGERAPEAATKKTARGHRGKKQRQTGAQQAGGEPPAAVGEKAEQKEQQAGGRPPAAVGEKPEQKMQQAGGGPPAAVDEESEQKMQQAGEEPPAAGGGKAEQKEQQAGGRPPAAVSGRTVQKEQQAGTNPPAAVGSHIGCGIPKIQWSR